MWWHHFSGDLTVHSHVYVTLGVLHRVLLVIGGLTALVSVAAHCRHFLGSIASASLYMDEQLSKSEGSP